MSLVPGHRRAGGGRARLRRTAPIGTRRLRPLETADAAAVGYVLAPLDRPAASAPAMARARGGLRRPSHLGGADGGPGGRRPLRPGRRPRWPALGRGRSRAQRHAKAAGSATTATLVRAPLRPAKKPLGTRRTRRGTRAVVSNQSSRRTFGEPRPLLGRAPRPRASRARPPSAGGARRCRRTVRPRGPPLLVRGPESSTARVLTRSGGPAPSSHRPSRRACPPRRRAARPSAARGPPSSPGRFGAPSRR